MSVPTVNLDPQDGDIAVFGDLQAVFDLKLSQSDVADWRTVGDMHQTLIRRLADRQGGEACATAMVFYRLRRALGGRSLQLTPNTPLAKLVGANPRQWRDDLQRALSLDMPSFSWTTQGTIGCYLSLVAVVCLAGDLILKSGVVAISSIAALLIGWALGRLDRLSLPDGLITVGDLTRGIAARNVGALVRQGARLREADIWDAICAILSDETGTPPDQIGPDSYLFAHVLYADRQAA